MLVLITGAGGNLGRAAIPVLEQEGHILRLLDFRSLDTTHELVVGDVRDPKVVAQAMVGVDAVVHGAALHGVHLETWAADDFWSINTGGTFTVYEAARAAGVSRVVLASSMVVYGGVGGDTSRWEVRTEESPFAPGDVYGLTKVVAEETARFFASVHHVDTVALRLGMFVPETFERYGFRLLFGGVDDRDVGQAVSLALAHDPQGGFDAFDIMADSGLSPEDLPALEADVARALDQRWPGTAELVEAHGLELDDLVWGRLIFPVEKAKSALSYRPGYDFAAFLAAWRRGDPRHYPYAGEPWWGMDPD
jgi:nucleoside-diphosphate-sugar epimerase